MVTEGTADFLIIVAVVVSFLLVSSFVVVAVVLKELRRAPHSVSKHAYDEAPSP